MSRGDIFILILIPVRTTGMPRNPVKKITKAMFERMKSALYFVRESNFVTSIRKEHRVVMSFAYTPVDFRRSLDLLIGAEIDLTAWTVRMPLARGQEALERMSRVPGVSLKMMLEVAVL